MGRGTAGGQVYNANAYLPRRPRRHAEVQAAEQARREAVAAAAADPETPARLAEADRQRRADPGGGAGPKSAL